MLTINKLFGEAEGKAEADEVLTTAEHRANAFAARLLAAHECPPDLIEWGKVHGIPTFAEVTWQAGFLAGIRYFELKKENIQSGMEKS